MALFVPISIALFVGSGIYSGLVSGIGHITMATCSTVKRIYQHKNPDINKIVSQLDLERRMLLITSVLNAAQEERARLKSTQDLVSEIPSEPEIKDHTVEEKSRITEMIDMANGKVKDPVEICLIFLRQTVHDIHEDLTKIDIKISAHKKKWFVGLRTLDIKDLSDTLEIHSRHLDSRFEDLTKITSFLTNQRLSGLGI